MIKLIIKDNNFLNHYKKNINNKFQSYKIKTICIGNIYLGGTGKTPIAIKINEILKILKYKTVFIKKYYSESLDEYRLLKKYGSVISDNKRIVSLNKANKDNEIAIFDDGLQDSSINYDLKLVCFNTSNFIGNGMLLPAGPLREKISSLKKYDAVFLNGNDERIDEITSVIKRYNNNIKIFNSTYVLIDLDILDKKNKYVAFAGIGNPKNFYSTLSNAGINVVKFLEYPDHYVYDDSDIKKIKDMAINFGAKIITTEKDYSRLEISNNPLLKENIQYLKMELKIKNESDLINFIKMKI